MPQLLLFFYWQEPLSPMREDTELVFKRRAPIRGKRGLFVPAQISPIPSLAGSLAFLIASHWEVRPNASWHII